MNKMIQINFNITIYGYTHIHIDLNMRINVNSFFMQKRMNTKWNLSKNISVAGYYKNLTQGYIDYLYLISIYSYHIDY